MKPLQSALSLFAWLFVRLPLAFSLPFAAISLWWIFSGFKRLNDRVAAPLARLIADFAAYHIPIFGAKLASNLDSFFHALVVIGLFLLGFLVAYNFSALLNWLLLGLKPMRYASGDPQIPERAAPQRNPFEDTQKIGIVLAGGGAKGAFQAGAMRAIYEFLAAHNALDKVKVLSATSIGSWNALFWLAHLIKPEKGWEGQGLHERWWRAINAKSLAAPSWYAPFFRNAFLSSAPWRRVFDHIFDLPLVRTRLLGSDIHFYLTRSDVGLGQLRCATNNPNPPQIARVTYDVLNAADERRFIEGLKTGVFASMDLPPLFPYIELEGRYYEDGGVIDNLPIQFPASEGCDLIFILPLNSDFEEEPNQTSIIARFLRVMDVRQGALERGGFKILYLYNELAALRNQLQASPAAAQAVSGSGPLNFALRRQHGLINVFAICPLKSFVQATINTGELWKTREAGIAFEVMRDATARELPNFQFTAQNKTKVALVGRVGNVTWDERF